MPVLLTAEPGPSSEAENGMSVPELVKQRNDSTLPASFFGFQRSPFAPGSQRYVWGVRSIRGCRYGDDLGWHVDADGDGMPVARESGPLGVQP